ncbi:MAG: ATP-binding cassette domain-containing protein [bacterium]
MNPLLVADCVSKSFRGRRVLSSGSLRAVPGELRVLFGRNGAGKSTLLKIAAGWIQPDSGSVHFDETAYLDARLPTLAERGLFYLPDHDLFSSGFSVRAQLEMIRRQFSGDDVETAAAVVGLAAVLDRRPGQLSGGERRRAEIAAILVRRPRCLLADEPFRGLAPKDAELMTGVLRGLASRGLAVVVTGHEVPTLLAAADHVTWCTAGTTYELGPPGMATAHNEFRRQYLGQFGSGT